MSAKISVLQDFDIFRRAEQLAANGIDGYGVEAGKQELIKCSLSSP